MTNMRPSIAGVHHITDDARRHEQLETLAQYNVRGLTLARIAEHPVFLEANAIRQRTYTAWKTAGCPLQANAVMPPAGSDETLHPHAAYMRAEEARRDAACRIAEQGYGCLPITNEEHRHHMLNAVMDAMRERAHFDKQNPKGTAR